MTTSRITLFWSHVDTSGDCWEWTGARSPLGYGRFRDSPRTWIASRFAWLHINGPIPPGIEVAHHCDNPPCVRPSHLFLATRTDNERDKVAKDRHNPSGFRNITHCKRGHLFDEGNTALKNGRWRRCRACTNAAGRERNSRPEVKAQRRAQRQRPEVRAQENFTRRERQARQVAMA